MKPSEQIIQEIQLTLSKLISPNSSQGYIDYIEGLSNEVKEIQTILQNETTANIKKVKAFQDNIIAAYQTKCNDTKPIQTCKNLTDTLIHNHLINYKHDV